ncbi:MAG: DEAD/DEAH box helicase [Tepidisphaeraceae bacterium]
MTLPHLRITRSGWPAFEAGDGGQAGLAEAFGVSWQAGFIWLVGRGLHASLPSTLLWARAFARRYLAELCRLNDAVLDAPIDPPDDALLAAELAEAPPMTGGEALSVDGLRSWWRALDAFVRPQAETQGLATFLGELNPAWHGVGRVTFHLAENKRDPERPFAFLATYVSKLNAGGRSAHVPLSRALQEYAGARDKPALLRLLEPIHAAAKTSALAHEMVDHGRIYQPLAWTTKEAYRFLQDVPKFEAAGIVTRVPDWWSAKKPPRPTVNVTIGSTKQSSLTLDALLDFKVEIALDGRPLSEAELEQLLRADGPLVQLRGQWVQVDPEKLKQAMTHWRKLQKQSPDGLSFIEGMRLLSGAALDDAAAAASVEEESIAWAGVEAGPWLGEVLRELRHPNASADPAPPGLQASLRPYQQAGVHWLRFVTSLGLGACLADDMGLGKTIQLISLLLHLKPKNAGPSLLVVPASLIPNWRNELARFAPDLRPMVVHPSEMKLSALDASAMRDADVVITTYGMLLRAPKLLEMDWQLAVLDEAQAIKNAGTKQTRAVKQIKSRARVALSGTPVENRLADLWSLFDFLNTGLLGSSSVFDKYVKKLAKDERPNAFAPLRSLVKPYILRRLKTDKSIINDLPDKVEMKAYCTLSAEQAAAYQQSVAELTRILKETAGIERRGVVLSFLMRFKQICNHPAQASGEGDWRAAASGKFARLSEICQELADRQQRVLIFTQVREMTEPLAQHLATVFGRPGLVLHGSTSIPQRKEMVEAFQADDGPPFFVLSIKAGGTGSNLTAAANVIHFDRWWNPAVENQATDRAFRIGQKQNVFVHKFITQGTVEEKIDELIETKLGLSEQLLSGTSAESALTEMSDRELLDFVSLDLKRATGG